MNKPRQPSEPRRLRTPSPTSVRLLRARLDDAEQALAAIRAGDVDTLVMSGERGERVFTLEGADHGYRVMLEVMSEGVAKLGADGLIDYCNARFAAILRLPLEQMIGRSTHDLVHADERDRFAALLAAGARARSEGEFRVRAPGAASDVPVLLSVVPVVTRGADRHCLVMTDLTEQRRNSDAIATERAEMHARLLLADRMLSMGALAAGVAHEINNPLSYVLASLELMASPSSDPSCEAGGSADERAESMRRQLGRAREGVERVRVIVRDLNAFSRADDESVSTVDPRRALDTAVALVSNEVKHRARLVRDYDGLPPIRANQARIEQVFVNLLVNAADAIAPGAADRNEIRITGRADSSGNAVIEIRDTGAGIAPENLARVFEPFFTTKAVGTGTGLGLALCHGIVSCIRGQITVASTPGEGTVLRVVVPAAPAVPAVPAVEAEVIALVAETRGRLLVVDDEEDLCEVLKESLASVHDVVTATDARRALEWIAAGERFDMILCDMRMPEMTGLEFHSRLGAIDRDQASRVRLMSGGFTRGTGEAELTLPSPVLEKPFEIERVLRLMREAMGPRAPSKMAS